MAKYHEGYFMGNKIRVEISHGGGRTAKYSGDPGACFKCGQMGHWARFANHTFSCHWRSELTVFLLSRECPNHVANGCVPRNGFAGKKHRLANTITLDVVLEAMLLSLTESSLLGTICRRLATTIAIILAICPPGIRDTMTIRRRRRRPAETAVMGVLPRQYPGTTLRLRFLCALQGTTMITG